MPIERIKQGLRFSVPEEDTVFEIHVEKDKSSEENRDGAYLVTYNKSDKVKCKTKGMYFSARSFCKVIADFDEKSWML